MVLLVRFGNTGLVLAPLALSPGPWVGQGDGLPLLLNVAE